MLAFVGECWGPILIPLACKESDCQEMLQTNAAKNYQLVVLSSINLSLRLRRAYLVVDVEDAILYFLVDLLGRIDERLLHVGRSFRRRFHEDEAVFSGEGLAFFLLHVTARFQITETWPMLGC